MYGLLHASASTPVSGDNMGADGRPEFAPVAADRRRPRLRVARPRARARGWPTGRPTSTGASRRAAARLPGPRPGLRARRSPPRLRPGVARASRASTSTTPLAGCLGDRPAPGVDVRPGAGDPRPAHRLHDLGLPRPVAAGRARRPAPPAVRRRRQHRRTTTTSCAPSSTRCPRRRCAAPPRTSARRPIPAQWRSPRSGADQSAGDGVGARGRRGRRTRAPTCACSPARPGMPRPLPAPRPSGPRTRTTGRPAATRRSRTRGIGVLRSLPAAAENSRNSAVTRQHTTCMPGSSPRFSQHPLR